MEGFGLFVMNDCEEMVNTLQKQYNCDVQINKWNEKEFCLRSIDNSAMYFKGSLREVRYYLCGMLRGIELTKR